MRRQNVEQPDDPELEARMSQMTNTWWCVLVGTAGTAWSQLSAGTAWCYRPAQWEETAGRVSAEQQDGSSQSQREQPLQEQQQGDQQQDLAWMPADASRLPDQDSS